MQQQQNAHYLQVISSEILYFYKLLHLQKKKKNLEFVWNFWLLAAKLLHQIVYCADFLHTVCKLFLQYLELESRFGGADVHSVASRMILYSSVYVCEKKKQCCGSGSVRMRTSFFYGFGSGSVSDLCFVKKIVIKNKSFT